MDERVEVLYKRAVKELSDRRFSGWLSFCFGVMINRATDSEIKLMEKDLEYQLDKQKFTGGDK